METRRGNDDRRMFAGLLSVGRDGLRAVPFFTLTLTRISHGPVRNAHGVPTFVGVSRELRYSSRAGAFAPAGFFPSSLRRVTFSQIEKFVRRSG